MAEDTPQQNKPESRDNGIDLSSLQDLALGPNWSSGNKPRNPRPSRERDDGDQSRRGGGQRRDRRGPRPPRNAGGQGEGRPPRESREGGERRGGRDFARRSGPPAPFRPTVDIAVYPEETPFKALTTAVRNSGRTFELFEIARLILEKTERFVLVIRPLAESAEKNLYVSVEDNLPFETESAALDHVFSKYADKFFEVEEVEVDPPKGNFVVINRCGITGELLGPPNYHRYQQLIQDHYNSRLTNCSWERFISRIESVRDQDAVNQWMEKMRKQTRYKLKDAESGTPVEFDTLDSARFHLIAHQKERLVREAQTVRLEGKLIEQMPEDSSIRKSAEAVLEQQRKFPLDTANNLRGRLRRMNFNVYKKGSKGISYVCAIRRRFRKPGETFTESVQQLVEFIEAHPNYPAVQLPKEYLGIEVPEEGEASLSEEDQANLRQLRTDLRWLTTSGYVTEYSDGRLFAPSPRDDANDDQPPPPPPPSAEDDSGAQAAKDQDETESTEAAPEAPAPAPDNSDPAVKEAEEAVEASQEEPSTAAATPDQDNASGKSEPDAPATGEKQPAAEKPADSDGTDVNSEDEAIVDNATAAPADEDTESEPKQA